MKMKVYLLILSLAILVHLGNTLSCTPCCADQPPSAIGPDGQIIMVGCTSCHTNFPHPCQLVKDACGCCDVPLPSWPTVSPVGCRIDLLATSTRIGEARRARAS